LGRIAGSLVGQGDLGASAGSSLSKLLGYGDYQLKSNSLMSGISSSGRKSTLAPTFSSDGRRGIRVADREYLGDIVSSSTVGAFNLQSYRINPADPYTFPWLSVIANQFEEWEPHGLVFEFVSTSSDYSGGASQALGTIISATDYDPVDSPPTTKLVMENLDYSLSEKCSNSMLHGVECDPKERPTLSYYTAYSAPSTDLRLHDHGNFFIASVGVPTASTTLGELWVSYDMSFYKKQLVSGQIGTTISDFYAYAKTSTGMNINDPLAVAAPNYASSGQLACTLSSTGSASRITFPPNIVAGSYIVLLEVNSSATVTLNTTSLTHGSGFVVTPIPGTYAGVNVSNVSAAGNYAICFKCITVVSPLNLWIDFSISAFTGALNQATARVLQINPLPYTPLVS